MSVRELWEELARRDVKLTAAAGNLRISAPAGAITPELRQRLIEQRDALLSLCLVVRTPDAETREEEPPRARTRQERVLAILAANPGFRYAVVTDSDSEPGAVVVHVAIHGIGSGAIVVAKDRYDGGALLQALENASTNVIEGNHERIRK